MSYACYLGGVAMPVSPSKLTVKIKNQNKTLVLLNEGEINLLRTPGLTEISLPLVFPMLAGQNSPDHYLSILEALKNHKQPTRFLLVRTTLDGKTLFDTNMKVSIEDYSIVEDAKDGLDVSVDVSLKQWRDYGTQTVNVEQSDGEAAAVTVETERDAATAPAASTHTVKKGETLWALAKKYYGNGGEYAKIYQANTDKISNPNLIYVGQVLTIP